MPVSPARARPLPTASDGRGHSDLLQQFAQSAASGSGAALPPHLLSTTRGPPREGSFGAPPPAPRYQVQDAAPPRVSERATVSEAQRVLQELRRELDGVVPSHQGRPRAGSTTAPKTPALPPDWNGPSKHGGQGADTPQLRRTLTCPTMTPGGLSYAPQNTHPRSPAGPDPDTRHDGRGQGDSRQWAPPPPRAVPQQQHGDVWRPLPGQGPPSAGGGFPPPPYRGPAPPPSRGPGPSSRESVVREALGAEQSVCNVGRLLMQTQRMGMAELLQTCQEEKQAATLKHDGATVGQRFRSDGTVLGEGSFAYVVSGKDARSGRGVAIKVLRNRFLAEAQIERDILSRLAKVAPRENRIVRLVDYHEDPSGRVPPCLVFPLHGPHLGKRLGQQGIGREAVRGLCNQLSGAITAMHQAGVVHTDIRPENIVSADPAGRGSDYILLDFGNASVHTRGEKELDEINTRPYRAPEVVLRTGWTFPCDIWALGCTLYEAAVGERLFQQRWSDQEHVSAMERVVGPVRGQPQHANAPAWPHAGVGRDQQLSGLLQRLLTADTSRRASAQEVAKHTFCATPQITA
eukprot:TRINITY_DN23787_c0_g1_i2.p1 TRINITY_DN23787_c0_g1~~TRINITY_DN23787_c0_g1_i2.p1  ORF type:complete len:602 (+),score=149.75 TRINITY_DN23787_c0_g1_i2:86-1807(+)